MIQRHLPLFEQHETFLTKKDCAAVLHVSERTFLNLVNRAKYAGVVSPFRPMHGVREYATMADLKAFIAAASEAGILPRKLSKLIMKKAA